MSGQRRIMPEPAGPVEPHGSRQDHGKAYDTEQCIEIIGESARRVSADFQA